MYWRQCYRLPKCLTFKCKEHEVCQQDPPTSAPKCVHDKDYIPDGDKYVKVDACEPNYRNVKGLSKVACSKKFAKCQTKLDDPSDWECTCPTNYQVNPMRQSVPQKCVNHQH
ncbi:unnamed protein product [Oppiella nova]|uniref:Uncharacterized protein n=1 Tax=Oppiella nova TaxID=334625 RepID=A0A7R9LTQ7_9ACAR|nr:unnamed protein product [Oppiella nova]CAG2166761.1 unnamed protein product [Oppiella nova]